MNLEQMHPDFQNQWETIIEKSREDENFKKELLANPFQVLEKMAGKPIDTYGMKIVVTDQSDASTLYVNIPTDIDAMELTEAQLEMVAGGSFDFKSWFGNCSTTVNVNVYKG
jgi:hypothetical protein